MDGLEPRKPRIHFNEQTGTSKQQEEELPRVIEKINEVQRTADRLPINEKSMQEKRRSEEYRGKQRNEGAEI